MKKYLITAMFVSINPVFGTDLIPYTEETENINPNLCWAPVKKRKHSEFSENLIFRTDLMSDIEEIENTNPNLCWAPVKKQKHLEFSDLPKNHRSLLTFFQEVSIDSRLKTLYDILTKRSPFRMFEQLQVWIGQKDCDSYDAISLYGRIAKDTKLDTQTRFSAVLCMLENFPTDITGAMENLCCIFEDQTASIDFGVMSAQKIIEISSVSVGFKEFEDKAIEFLELVQDRCSYILLVSIMQGLVKHGIYTNEDVVEKLIKLNVLQDDMFSIVELLKYLLLVTRASSHPWKGDIVKAIKETAQNIKEFEMEKLKGVNTFVYGGSYFLSIAREILGETDIVSHPPTQERKQTDTKKGSLIRRRSL
jgi:hypothetical protein